MIQFHYCSIFKEKIKKGNFKENIDKKIQENKKRKDLKNIGNIHSFAAGIYVLKITNPNIRIVIEEKNINIDESSIKVFFVRDLISESTFDNEYGRILYKKLQNREWLNSNPLDNADIDSYKKYYISQKDKEEEKKEVPPDNLTSWLDEFSLELNNEIFETEQWVKYALNDEKLEGMQGRYVNTFRLLIEELKDNPTLGIEEKTDIYKYEKHNVGVLYTPLEIGNKNYIVLHNAAHLETQERHWKEVCYSTKIEFDYTLDSISKFSYRTYPKWTVSDDDFWFAIEKSAEMSNLSLTTEQSNFLQQFKFPQYINGQAGSGKSTMLYYLFANVFYFKELGSIDGNIMFLTENENLLDDTKNNVWDLLSNNPEFNLNIEEKDEIDKCFNSFKNFLLGMLTENDLAEFDKDKYLNFSIFKNLYEKSNLPKHIIKKYSAEESWFTIITYIYGYDIDKELSSIDYENEISRGSKIISVDKFKGIEKNVLPFYKNLIEEKNYWDKLKIIRYINENINTNLIDKYTVLVCDEAQDFCKVELDFILKQSVYLQYDLSQISQVPILFAGDPNQTVNPTGFRQDEMTSLLYKELREKANFSSYNKDNIIYSPSINYRSTHAVVALANFVQFYRMKNLGVKNIKPQKAKRPMTSDGSNNFLNFNDIENNKELKMNLIKKLQYKVFIVPVDSEEKNVYKSRSNLLSQIKDIELRTSVESKGAEYKQVVLYGFGEYYLEKFTSLKGELNEEEKFQVGYYFNKLYVGLTRAQTELIIIDSKESEELFWKQLLDETKVDTEWKIQNDVIIYNSNTINNVLDSTKNDALDNAKQDKKMGEHESNPARLKVAANQFLKLGYKNEANECLALEAEINNSYKQAANFFKQADNLEKASCSLFKGRYFDDLDDIGFSLKSITQEIRLIISRIMQDGFISENDIKTLSNNRNALYDLSKDLTWRKDLLSSCIRLEKKIDDLKLKKDFLSVLKHISVSKEKDRFLSKEIGRISYELEDYAEAVNYWEAIDEYDNNKNYFIAKLKLAERDHDDQYVVIWLYSLIQFQNKEENRITFYKILDIHEKVNSETFKNEYFLAIYGAYIGIEDEENINRLGNIVEEKYQDNLLDLQVFYLNILKYIDIYVYVVERWAKTMWKLNKSNKDQNWLDELNKKSFLESYKKFTFGELEQISEFPNSVQLMPSEQLSNIQIKSFRHFKDLQLSNIGQFNLIIGDNNIGKTSLLEALMFTVDIEEYLKNLIFAYIARNNSTKIKDGDEEQYSKKSLINFIKDFIPKDSDDKILEFTLEENRSSWNFKIRIATQEEISKNLNRESGIIEENYIAIIMNDEIYKIIELPIFIERIEPKQLIQMQLIPFGKGFDRDLAINYYENIHKDRKNRKRFLDAMKTFIPKIEEIEVDTKNGDIDIYEEEDDVPSSLHQYGEGANKLFRILVQITLQKDKKLLIDEIDAGIHYSHFFEFWKVILKVAKDYNVQIFATTHNLECLEYFKSILEDENFEEYQELSRTITLRRLPDNRIKAYIRKFEEFEYELNNDFEIRGGNL